MPSSKKRSCRSMSDSDDDSDDDLLTSVFGTSRASKRKNAKDEAAKKKKRMAQMNALLDNGKVKLERENRMDKLCQENNDMMRDESLDRKKNDKSNSSDEGKSSNDATSSLSREQRQQEYQPKDDKETSCLGSRSTLQFSRVIYIQQKTDATSPDANDKEPCGFKPFWFGLEDALIDLRTILLADRQIHQRLSSFASIRDELLKLCTSKSTYACRTYLRKRLLFKQEDQERVRRIPVNVLRWLMALACGPVINGCTNGDSSNNENRTENTRGKENTKQAARRPQNLTKKDNCSSKTTDLIASQRLLMEAQLGAYQTLNRLWSQDLGFPLQQQQQSEIYLLSIAALPRQLCQWFGSSFSFDTAIGSSDRNSKAEEQNDNLSNENNKDPLRVTSSHTALIRFLQLWALVLQKQNNNDNIGKNVHLVQFHYDKENRAGLRNDISVAIMAVLWAGLNPSFASSRSAKNDGNKAIRTIVACLLDRVRLEDTYYNDGNGDIDSSESFRHWLQTLSEQICTTWSKKLGRGQRGTDAYEDEHAWLCLARSVARLVRIDGGDYENVGGSYGDLKGHGHRERMNESPLKDFQLSLCRSILKRAFAADQAGHQLRDMKTKREEKINNGDGKSDDWVLRFVDEEMRRMNVPFEIRVSQRWQAMTLAVVGLTKLASSFPEEEASKCFALMDVCTVCFQSTIVELEHEIQKHSLKEKKRGSDDNDDNQITNDNATTITSRSVKDEVLEKHALYNAYMRLEHVSEIISNKTRVLIMRNICFPWASHMAESLRNYARSQKEQYAPPSVTNRVAPVKQQSMISTFFKDNKPSGKLITN